MAAIRAAQSPALAKSAELNELADELKASASSAERIVHEVDELFEKLKSDTAEKQIELTAILQKVEEGLSLDDLSAKQREALRAFLNEDSSIRERKQLRTNIALAVFGIAGGYVASLLYPADELRQRLFP